MCDRTDEQLYDLEFKHTKSQKEEEDLQKRISDIKCKFSKNNHFWNRNRQIRTKLVIFEQLWSYSGKNGQFLGKSGQFLGNCGQFRAKNMRNYHVVYFLSIFESANDVFIIDEVLSKLISNYFRKKTVT